jgi:hypothetical protein
MFIVGEKSYNDVCAIKVLFGICLDAASSDSTRKAFVELELINSIAKTIDVFFPDHTVTVAFTPTFNESEQEIIYLINFLCVCLISVRVLSEPLLKGSAKVEFANRYFLNCTGGLGKKVTCSTYLFLRVYMTARDYSGFDEKCSNLIAEHVLTSIGSFPPSMVDGEYIYHIIPTYIVFLIICKL